MAARRFVFTVNNPDAPLDRSGWRERGVVAAVWQLERGSQGTPHFQGYIKFERPRRFRWVQETLGRACHVEVARGSDDDCIKYCTKEDTRVSGPFWHPDQAAVRSHRQGSRTDLASLCDMLKEGKSYGEICAEDPAAYARNARYLREVALVMDAKQPRPFVRSLTLHGPAGIGKSTWAYTHLAQPVYCPTITENGTVWFDGYDGEPVLLLDDYRGQLDYTLFNRLLDRWYYRAPIKGGFVVAKWTYVLILTNVPPTLWYPAHKYEDAVVDAVLRRAGYGKWDGADPDRRYKYVGTREELDAFASLFVPASPAAASPVVAAAAAAPNEEEAEEPPSKRLSCAPTPALTPPPDSPPHSPSFYAPHP